MMASTTINQKNTDNKVGGGDSSAHIVGKVVPPATKLPPQPLPETAISSGIKTVEGVAKNGLNTAIQNFNLMLSQYINNPKDAKLFGQQLGLVAEVVASVLRESRPEINSIVDELIDIVDEHGGKMTQSAGKLASSLMMSIPIAGQGIGILLDILNGIHIATNLFEMDMKMLKPIFKAWVIMKVMMNEARNVVAGRINKSIIGIKNPTIPITPNTIIQPSSDSTTPPIPITPNTIIQTSSDSTTPNTTDNKTSNPILGGNGFTKHKFINSNSKKRRIVDIRKSSKRNVNHHNRHHYYNFQI